MRTCLAGLLAALLACSAVRAVEPGAQPGALPYPDPVKQALAEAWIARPSRYQPRTRHLDDHGAPRYLNRLFLETSPYLLQHAHNPVDWRPWGDEAFEEARRLGRPVLLSVGYSTCHWCHVMEEESFEDEEVAEFLNRNYIAIKVDREERPDVDAFYMSAVSLLTGGAGGWPMTVWLTPDRKPYYATSYLPPHDGDRGVRFGFQTLLGKMRDVYVDSPDTVANNAEVLTRQMQRLSYAGEAGELPGPDALERAADAYAKQFDQAHGGLEGAPKFPSSLPVRFLLRRGDQAMAIKTLEAMARGGIHDHIGGGFHRYTVDAAWRVPHFEQMLYDNALLARAYLEGYQATGREEFARTARDVLDYLGGMRSAEGGFYSATDADSRDPANGKPVEGRFFTWTREEIEAALGPEDAAKFLHDYPLTEDAKAEGRFVLHRKSEAAHDALRIKLFQARSKRPAPFLDEKIVTSWNGLAISALAFGGFVLDDPSYTERAELAADFVLAELHPGGRLARAYRGGRTSGAAFLDDYAFLIAGLIDLYETSGDVRRLERALELDRELAGLYEDPDGGGFYFTAADQEQALLRAKPVRDGAEPSGNSVQILNLLRLHEFTTDDRFRVRADRALRAFASTIEGDPTAVSELLLAIEFRRAHPLQILVVASEAGANDAEPLLDVLRRTFIPNRILAVASEADLPQVQAVVPLFADKRAIGGRTTVYVCRERICRLPTSDPARLEELLGAESLGAESR